MKKYSPDYFKKRYQILFEKLLQKESFIDDISKARIELGLPANGFTHSAELAYFFIGKMKKKEQEKLTMIAFLNAFEYEQKRRLTDDDEKDFTKAFVKKHKKDNGIGMLPMMMELGQHIEAHHNIFTNYHLFEDNKYLSTLYKATFKLMQKYWGVDLLDDHIIFHYIEKYLFMGQAGIDMYIKGKTSCHNCKYLGVDHFSPNRFNMQGQDKGPYNSKYIFNKQTVKMLSQHFHSVFLIIKPYATKELVIQYIEDNWDDLKEHIIEKNTFYKQYDVHPSIIKESDNEKNRLVYELNKLSKKDLLKRYKGVKDFNLKGVYKETIISAILEEEHNIKMTSDAVKKTATRFAKTIRTQNIPKDIRDI
jgi:hypothetical protein